MTGIKRSFKEINLIMVKIFSKSMTVSKLTGQNSDQRTSSMINMYTHKHTHTHTTLNMSG